MTQQRQARAEHNTRVALYARVSTEDQAERQTVQAQLDFLRRWCELNQFPIAGEYVDDGISGTVSLDRRPEGRRLLEDAAAGRFGTVVAYRVDRLGRSLRALLDAHDALEVAGVALRSGTEPIDTSTPIGRFIFQLLGSFAELERETIKERTTRGRDRVAKDGRYTGGTIPLGYDVAPNGRLVLSEHLVPGADMTEAELVRDLFQRIAAGSSTFAEAQRLNALGVRPVRRYAAGKVKHMAESRAPARIAFLLHNPAYKGDGRLHSGNGHVTRPYVELVEPETWDQAQAALTRNQVTARGNAKRLYLLRRLIRCENCGRGYHGAGSPRERYRCNGTMPAIVRNPAERCKGKGLSAGWLEALIWADCAEWVRNPGPRLEEARQQLQGRAAGLAGAEERRRDLLAQLAAKEAESDRVLTMFRRARVTMEQADRELEAIAQETATLRAMLDSLRAQAALIDAQEAHLADAATMLTDLRGEVDEIERTRDGGRMRRIIELLVRSIDIRTEGEGRAKRATVTVRYAFAQPAREVVPSLIGPHP